MEARLPWALDMIRKFGDLGHEVYAADTFGAAPGMHSKSVTEHFTVPSPRYDTISFIARMRELTDEHGIDLLIPAAESAFFLAKHVADFGDRTELFMASFSALAQLHDKSAFMDLSNEIGAPVPATETVATQAALAKAISRYDHYMARASYTRGGVDLLTNTGPRAGTMTVDEAHPTETNPWVVQEFIVAQDICSYSLARNGHVAAHVTYEHPKELDHASGIRFVSIDEPRTLELARKYVEATNYTGEISFDYLRNDDGIWMVECNPRGTDGILLMTAKSVVDAVVDKHLSSDTNVTPAGATSEIDMALVLDMVQHWKSIPTDIHDLLTTTDAIYRPHDALPFLYQFLQYGQVLEFKRHSKLKHDKSAIMRSTFDDSSWDGGPIP